MVVSPRQALRMAKIEKRKPVVTIFTCCDRRYEDFILLFCLSILKHVPDSLIEICVEDDIRYKTEQEKTLKYLYDKFGDQILIRTSEYPNTPATARFISDVVSETEYVYISDIDFIILKGDIVEKHVTHMKETGLPYSNMVRGDTKRMTGVHFTRRDSYYPVDRMPRILALAKKLSDEEILYYVVLSKNLPLPKDDFRPLFGIHMSPNRHATDKLGWSINGYREEWKVFRETEEFKFLYPFFSGRIKNCIDLIDYIVKS